MSDFQSNDMERKFEEIRQRHRLDDQHLHQDMKNQTQEVRRLEQEHAQHEHPLGEVEALGGVWARIKNLFSRS